jgi:hypothetical protein
LSLLLLPWRKGKIAVETVVVIVCEMALYGDLSIKCTVEFTATKNHAKRRHSSKVPTKDRMFWTKSMDRLTK